MRKKYGKIAISGCVLLIPIILGCSSSGSTIKKQETQKPVEKPIDWDWNPSIVTSGSIGAIAYLRSHPGSIHDQELLEVLKQQAKPTESLTITTKFKEFMEYNSFPSSVNCSIQQVNKNIAIAGGLYDELPVSTQKRTGDLISLTWNPGATHTIIGSLLLHDYCFVSSKENPLVFSMVWNVGYMYRRGSGVVVDPKGVIYKLGL